VAATLLRERRQTEHPDPQLFERIRDLISEGRVTEATTATRDLVRQFPDSDPPNFRLSPVPGGPEIAPTNARNGWPGLIATACRDFATVEAEKVAYLSEVSCYRSWARDELAFRISASALRGEGAVWAKPGFGGFDLPLFDHRPLVAGKSRPFACGEVRVLFSDHTLTSVARGSDSSPRRAVEKLRRRRLPGFLVVIVNEAADQTGVAHWPGSLSLSAPDMAMRLQEALGLGEPTLSLPIEAPDQRVSDGSVRRVIRLLTFTVPVPE
jgi:hypothetical protein